tara:strand:+ start:1345 stop:1806 length:462 start_codon:yes stop_codon:yes gene_type:complete
MSNRRELTPEEQREAVRLKAIYEDRKAAARAKGERLSQALVAEMCGWSNQSAFGHYVIGRIPLNLDALLLLAKHLQFDPAEVSPRLMANLPATRYADANQEYFLSKQYLDASDEHREAVDALAQRLLSVSPEQALKLKKAMELLIPEDVIRKD